MNLFIFIYNELLKITVRIKVSDANIFRLSNAIIWKGQRKLMVWMRILKEYLLYPASSMYPHSEVNENSR